MLSYKEESMVWVSNLSAKKLEKYVAEWTRLRNAVYVNLPLARAAGATINDINSHLANETNKKKKRKDYIKSREKRAAKQFYRTTLQSVGIPGKVLSEATNRQTGNDCYDIIKEYKGGFTCKNLPDSSFSSWQQPETGMDLR